MRYYQWFLLSLGLTIASAQHDELELRQLTDDNFRASTARGLWLVEHFSPKCSHCRAFAPTWEQIALEKRHLERLSGFHMAQVNCLAQGDLCNANNIKFYPQLVLYSDGSPTTYTGERSHGELTKWINEQSTIYAHSRSLGSEDSEESLRFSRPNREGKVLDVDEAGLDALVNAGPVLVDFFAPWCGHCKKLRPIYEELAEVLKNKVNVAAVDCEANKIFCRRKNVQAYPTIRLLGQGTELDYNGARSLEKMQNFAVKAVKSGVLQNIKLEEFGDIVHSEDAFFLYLQNFDTAVADLDAIKAALLPISTSISAYTSSDPSIYSNLSIANPIPTSVLLAFSGSTIPVATLAFPANQDQITRFVNMHRFPTLTHLTKTNYAEIMKSSSRAIIVLGAVHKGASKEQEVAQLETVAKAWKRGGRGFQQPVLFAWVEGEKWSGWLRQAYGIKKSELPAVVVIDTPLSEYYDTTIEGNRVDFDGSAIFSVLEGVYQHFLRPKKSDTGLEWSTRGAAMTLLNLGAVMIDHPFGSVLGVVGSVALFVFLLQKCMRDPREGRDHSGGNRLD